MSNYKLELDIFSGLENPMVEITRDDFEKILNEIKKLAPSEPKPLFDGLGFRGIIISAAGTLNIFIQDQIIKLQSSDSEQYFISDNDVVRNTVDLFIRNDKDGKYKEIVEKVRQGYL